MDKFKMDPNSLRAQYCPPLDEGLFYAISSDYNLADSTHRQALIRILDELKEVALEQETSDFDPSGTGGGAALQNAEISTQSLSRSSPDESNGVTSITTGLSDLKWDTNTGSGEDADDLTVEEKEKRLREIFPAISADEISQILKQCSGIFGQATDELLNVSFLATDGDENGNLNAPIPKSVDAFIAEETGFRKRKGRSKNKSRTNESSRASSAGSFSVDSTTTARNVWTSLAEDVAFICERTHLQPQVVKSVYHAEGTDLAATVKALAVKESCSFGELADLAPVMQQHVIDLKNEFQSIPESQLFGLVVLARGIPSAARELLEVMVATKDPVLSGNLNGIAQYAPLNLSKEKENDRPATQNQTPRTTIDRADVKTSAAAHSLAANTRFSQASTYHRLGKSNPLMGGASAYYAAEGHKHVQAAKDISAAAADARVQANSTSSTIDLHGTSVSDAVRIARDRVEYWWESLGDAKYGAGGGGPVRAGFRIVTGVGRHSKDGAPRIGPAVSKMLMREGWKVEIEQGELVVKGKKRH